MASDCLKNPGLKENGFDLHQQSKCHKEPYHTKSKEVQEWHKCSKSKEEPEWHKFSRLNGVLYPENIKGGPLLISWKIDPQNEDYSKYNLNI